MKNIHITFIYIFKKPFHIHHEQSVRQSEPYATDTRIQSRRRILSLALMQRVVLNCSEAIEQSR